MLSGHSFASSSICEGLPSMSSRLMVSAVAVAAVAVAATGCSASSGGATSSSGGGGVVIPVAASINAWGSILTQLGGSHVNATSIITNPDTDPHDYEPTPADG